jgi:hypothetical protein
MARPVIRNHDRRAVISTIRFKKSIRIPFNLAANAHAKFVHQRDFYILSPITVFYHNKNIAGYNHKSKNFVPGAAMPA